MKKNKVEKETTCNKEYNLVKNENNWNPYWEDCWNHHPYKVNRKNNLKYWKKKRIYRFQYREYRSWKHNRKQQWKS
jgi:hypothetical protein